MFTPEVTETPYQSGATRVLLLGSGELGEEVTIAFQRPGVEVHAADRCEHTPAHQVVHHAYVSGISDPSALRDLILQVKPHFIVPEIEALATGVLVEVEEDEMLDITVIPTARATQLAMNREGIRRLAAEEVGLPTSRYHFASSFDEFTTAVDEVGFPCVVKPVMSSSDKGQFALCSSEDVQAAWGHAMSGGRVESGRVTVEGFVDFDYETTLLTVRSVDLEVGETAMWFCEPIGHRQQDGDYMESWQPVAMSENAPDNARSVAARIINALGGRGIFGAKLFVHDDEVWFSEVSPRLHDTGMVTMGTQRFSEFELHARTVLNLSIDVTLVSSGASAVVYGGVDIEQPGYTGLTEAIAIPETDIRIFGKPVAGPRRRMVVTVSTADSVDVARGRASEAASKTKVVELG